MPAPWETTQPQNQAPWERTAPGVNALAEPAKTRSVAPWEAAELQTARLEENTLFGRGKAETVIGEFGAGLQKGVRQIGSTPHALAALALEEFDYLTGFDNDALTRQLIEDAIGIAEGGAERGIGRLEDMSINPMTWLRYASGTLGESIPFLASIMAGGGAPALLAKLMARKGIAASTRATLLKNVPQGLVGATATGTAIETGATAQELYQATDEVRPGASLLAGTAKGSLEAVFPMMLSRQLGLTGGQATELMARLFTRSGAKQVGKAIGTEAATEYAQEEIDLMTRSYLDEKFSFLSPEANSRRINALLAGATGGGLIQTGAQLMLGRDPDGPPAAPGDVQRALEDVPIIIGQAANELPVTSPDDILRMSPVGGPTTVTAANAIERVQLLAQDPLKARGLYAPVVPGMEPHFGTQDEAIDDGRLLRGQGYLRLDPSVVSRGDITVAVQDLPNSLADSRISFLDQNTLPEATTALTEAIKLKNTAAKARSGQRREELLTQAQQHYRVAINNGVRVEPLSDSQVILRDPNKLAQVASQMERLVAQESEAGLLETRELPGGKKFHVFDTSAESTGQGFKGRKLDLEKVDPDAMTAVPTGDMINQVLATHEVSRRGSLGRARALGIRFARGVAPERQQALLAAFVRTLKGMSSSTPFNKMPGPMVDRFMKLVDLGLRLDVKPGTKQFVVLDPQGEGVFTPFEDESESTVRIEGETARIVKGRAKRGREPRISANVQFESDAVATAFFSTLHSTEVQRWLAGDVQQGPAPVQYPGGPTTEFIQQKSPLAAMIRAVIKPLGLPTDYVIEVVSPTTLPDQGVRYVEKSIQLPGGRRSEPRSVIQVNPWYYAEPTKGQKPLTKPAAKYVIKGGPVLMFVGNNKKDLNRRVIYNGQETSLGEVLKLHPLKVGEYPVLSFPDNVSKPGIYEGNFSIRVGPKIKNDIFSRWPNAKPINNPMAQDVLDYQRFPDAYNLPEPAYTPVESKAGEAARSLGLGSTKQFVTNDRASEFYADVAVALSESIVTFEWTRTDAGMQELLQDEWRREMHLAQGTLRDKQLSKVIPHPLLDRALGDRGRKSNQFAFEEWLVMHTARYLTHGNPNKRLSAVTKFFSKTASYLRRTIESLWKKANSDVKPYSLDPNLGQPHEVVQRWLDQLTLRGVFNTPAGQAQPFLEEATRNALIDSINKNQSRFRLIGLDAYVVAAPERASSRQVRELIKILPKEAVADRRKLEGLIAAADKHSTMLDWMVGIHQLADMNPHLLGLRDYVSLTRAQENSALSWATMADERLREAQKLGKTQLEAVTNLLFDLDQMVYLDPAKLADGTQKARWPTEQELLALVQKHKLTKEAFDIYVAMRDDFTQFLAWLESVSVQQAQDTLSDPAELKAKIDEIRGETMQLKSRPYFPHMRFGKYVLVVKGKKNKTIHFEAFQSKNARDAGAKQLEQQFAQDIRDGNARILEDELSEVMQQYQGLPPYALKNVQKALGLDAEEALLTTQQKKDLAALEAMTLQAMPTESFRRHLVGRKNVPGWSKDALRAYANYFGRSAKFMARLEFSTRLQDSIKSVRDSGSLLTRDKRTSIADAMQRHYEAQMEPARDWADLRGVGFMWYFAFAPAAAFVNLTQVPMVSMPFLASKFGDVKTWGRVIAAYTQAMREMFGQLRGQTLIEDTVKMEALEEAHFSRLVDDGYAAELTALSQGPVLQSTIPGSKATRALRRFAQWGTLPFQLAERMNRSVTFRAAYDLAIKNNDAPWIDEVMELNAPEVNQLRIDRGWDERHLRAYMAAADAVRKTQFEYARWSRPKLMDGPRGVLLMFKTYLQNMLYFMFKQDRGTQARFMLGLLFAAGVMGVPGAEDMSEIAKWLAKNLGYRFDAEHFVRGLMTSWGAGEASDIVLHGASREGFGIPHALNGLGIPTPRIDLSGSLSMGRIIPGLKPLLNPGSSMTNDAVGEVVSEVAGPVFGVPFAMYQSIIDNSLPAEDPKRWERAMPRAMKAVSRASRYLAEERERSRTGADIIRFDPNDLNDQVDILLGVGLGFQPTRLSQTWDYLRAQTEVQNYWKGQRQLLMSELHRAHRLKDVEGKRDAIEAIRRFNDEAPDRALKITGQSLSQSLQTRERARGMKEQNIPREKYLRGVAKEVDALYPEVVHSRKLPMPK